MTRSPRDIESLFTEAHAASGPTPKERLRALQRLETSIAMPPVVPLSELSSRQSEHVSGPSVAASRATGTASATKWAALFLLALVAGEATRIGLRREPPGARVGPDATAPTAGSAAVSAAPSFTPRPLPTVALPPAPLRPVVEPPGAAGGSLILEPSAPGTPRSALPRAEPAPRAARSKAIERPAPLPETPDLHEALRWLRRAQGALRAGNGREALSLLDELARRSPNVLVEEREVTRALALCATGDESGAERVALSVRTSWPGSPYAHRLSQSCVGPEPPPAQLLEEMRRRTPD